MRGVASPVLMDTTETLTPEEEAVRRRTRFIANLEYEERLDGFLAGRREWFVSHYGEVAADMKLSAEAKLAGIVLNLYQPNVGPNVPFPRFEEIAEQTGGFRVHDMNWAIPELMRKGHLHVDFPEPVEERQSKPTARRKAKIEPSLRWEVWERDDFTCKHCGSRKLLQVDHVIPESRGGPTTLDDLQTLCGTCNGRKGARMPE
jgi:hypothetical protein